MKTEIKKASVKNKVEAVLFSIAHRISVDEISKFCREKKDEILVALEELKKDYDEKQSSLILIEDGDFWKLTVRDHFAPIIRKIVTETELTKTVLETLAVIAFKYPILQSDLIKIRTNKAYDHLAELEESGYISRQKHSRTNLIKLTGKFFKYFDLTEESLKDKFKDFESIAKTIKEKEEESNRLEEEQIKKAEDLKKEEERIKKEIDNLEDSGEEFEIPLETYEAKADKLADKLKSDLSIEKKEKSEKPKQEKVKQTPQITHAEKGIILTPEAKAKVDKKVEEILHPERGSKEENQNKN